MDLQLIWYRVGVVLDRLTVVAEAALDLTRRACIHCYEKSAGLR